MKSRRRSAVSGLALVAALVAAGTGFGAQSYPDPPRDVTNDAGPDVVAIRLSHTRTHVIFGVTFASAPPLRVAPRGRWVDMLLVGLDVPPLGPRPVSPGGEWRGANYALGLHGPSRRGTLVRLPTAPDGRARVVRRLGIVVLGATLRFSVPRRDLGNPATFAFVVAAARESGDAHTGGFDVAPDRGTFRYRLAG